jgi:hypothetical protein
VKEFLSNTNNSEKAVEFTENLAASVQTEEVLSEQDLFQSTKLMEAASNAKPKNSTDAKNIIKVGHVINLNFEINIFMHVLLYLIL